MSLMLTNGVGDRSGRGPRGGGWADGGLAAAPVRGGLAPPRALLPAPQQLLRLGHLLVAAGQWPRGSSAVQVLRHGQFLSARALPASLPSGDSPPLHSAIEYPRVRTDAHAQTHGEDRLA